MEEKRHEWSEIEIGGAYFTTSHVFLNVVHDGCNKLTSVKIINLNSDFAISNSFFGFADVTCFHKALLTFEK